MRRHLKYHEIHGTRRPFPSLYEAIKLYGADNVYFDTPEYVENKHCRWCGKEIIAKDKRQRVYCSPACRDQFANATVWGRTRDAYSLRICYRDNFTCQDCGELHAIKNRYGVFIPADDGELNVHHIKPVSEGGGDEPTNLITLCKSCHKKRHNKNISGENNGS